MIKTYCLPLDEADMDELKARSGQQKTKMALEVALRHYLKCPKLVNTIEVKA